MIRRVLLAAAAPLAAVLTLGPLTDRLARRLVAAPRRLPEEAGMGLRLDALGGEVVRLRARDGIALAARWLRAEPDDDWAADPREAILLLHGYSGSIVPDLLEYGPFLRRTAGVLGLDFRGHGDSDDAPTTLGMHEVEDVAGALEWLGERGIARVALVGSSMGGITAIAAVAVLGDGRLASADLDPAAPAAPAPPPRPRIVAVVADAVAPDLASLLANRMPRPFGRLLAGRALAGAARLLGGDPRATEPVRMIGLLEDVPLLLVHGGADRNVPPRHAARLVAAAPPGTRRLVVPGADHSLAHRTDPGRWEAEVGRVLRDAFRGARS